MEKGDGRDHRGHRLQGEHKNTSGQGCLKCTLIILVVCASGPFKLHAFSTCNSLFYIPIKLPEMLSKDPFDYFIYSVYI